MTKLETKLGRDFINKLRIQCSEKKERIKIFKTHGNQYQETGVSDYIGFFNGKGIAIEFKVEPNVLTQKQREFLMDVAQSGNVAICLTFRKNILTKYHIYYILEASHARANLGVPSFWNYTY